MLGSRLNVQLPALAVGVLAGAGLRWAVAETTGEVTTLLVVNTIGCAVIGFVAATTAPADTVWATAVGVGFCGGLTTLSGLTLALAKRLDDGRAASAAWLAVASMVGCAAAFAAGHWLGATRRSA